MSESTKAVFLSYARDDAAAARRIAEALRAFGMEVWFDQDELRGGDSWDQKIRTQIRTCSLFLPIISAGTQSRGEGYFRREWKLAVERSHDMAEGVPFMVPVVIDDTPESAALVPEQFMRVQWSRLPGGAPSHQFVEQVERLLRAPRGAHTGTTTTQPRPAAAAHSPASVAPANSLRPIVVTVALLLALGVGAFFILRSRSPVTPTVPAAASAKPALATAAIAPAVNAKSIAVLPFANMSEDKDANAFFADGMHEDILTNLALVRDLKVVSRTSVMEYRSTTKKIRQIATELGVAYILEGSVRRAGSKVRVTGQLINAATDEHLWAKSYDRDITDIFAIQSELSQAIAAALSAALSPQEKSLIERRPTDNLAAYDLYLKGRAFFMGTRTDMSRAQAEAALAEAVQLDPNFAQAWGYLAAIHGLAVFGDEDRSAERLAKAKAAIDTAVRLAPSDPDVIEMQGSYFYYGYRDYARAAEHYQRALLVKPNSGDLYTMIGFIMRRQGRWADTLANLRHAQELDPRNLNTLFGLGLTLEGLRRYDEAAVAYRRLAEIAPDDPFQTGVSPYVEFLKSGSTAAFDQWLVNQKPTSIGASKMLVIRRGVLALHGDWAAIVKLDQEQPYADPYDDPHWVRDAAMIFNLVGNNDLPAARARAEKLIPTLQALLKQQPANARLWSSLASLHALLGEKEPALSAARKAVELVPVSSDAMIGPILSIGFAQVLAWTGDKESALAELARLLRTPFGGKVYLMRVNPSWKPLWGDPRFEALLNDPKNNAPIDDTK